MTAPPVAPVDRYYSESLPPELWERRDGGTPDMQRFPTHRDGGDAAGLDQTDTLDGGGP